MEEHEDLEMSFITCVQHHVLINHYAPNLVDNTIM